MRSLLVLTSIQLRSMTGLVFPLMISLLFASYNAHALQLNDLPYGASVNSSTELAVSVPIQLPVGKGGQQPSLSFDYLQDSFPYVPGQSDNDTPYQSALFWTLSGIPRIDQCKGAAERKERVQYQNNTDIPDIRGLATDTKLCLSDGHSYSPLFSRGGGVYSVDSVGDDHSTVVIQTKSGASPSGFAYALVDEVSHSEIDFSRLSSISGSVGSSGPSGASQQLSFSSSSQSTNYSGVYPASNAVDGVDGTFTHTSKSAGEYEWWLADLGAEYDVDQIHVTNRTSCCQERMNANVLLFSADKNPADFSPAQALVLSEYYRRIDSDESDPDGPGNDYTFKFGNTGTGAILAKARYVMVYQRIPNEYLQVGEVRVWGKSSGGGSAQDNNHVAYLPKRIYDEEFGNDINFTYGSVTDTNSAGQTVTSGILPTRMSYDGAGRVDVDFTYQLVDKDTIGSSIDVGQVFVVTGVAVSVAGTKEYEYEFELDSAIGSSPRYTSYSAIRKCKNKNTASTCDTLDLGYASSGFNYSLLNNITSDSGSVLEYARPGSGRGELTVNGKTTVYLRHGTVGDYRFRDYETPSRTSAIALDATPNGNNIVTSTRYVTEPGNSYGLPEEVQVYYTTGDANFGSDFSSGDELISETVYRYDSFGRLDDTQSTRYHSSAGSGSVKAWATDTDYSYTTGFTIQPRGSKLVNDSSSVNLNANKLSRVVTSVPSTEASGTFVNSVSDYQYYNSQPQNGDDIHQRNYLWSVKSATCSDTSNFAQSPGSGAIQTCLDRSGQQTAYGYGGVSGGTAASLRVIREYGRRGYGGGTTAQRFTTTYTGYDSAGNVTGIDRDGVASSFSYDSNQVALDSTTIGPVTTTFHEYDPAFGTYGYITRNNYTTNYVYDELGRVTQIYDENNHTVDLTIGRCGSANCDSLSKAAYYVEVDRSGVAPQTTIYNVDGQPIRSKTQTDTNGINSGGVVNVLTNYLYYDNRLLKEVQGPYQSGTSVGSRKKTYEYERWGRVSKATDFFTSPNNVLTYVYDSLGSSSEINPGSGVRLLRQTVTGIDNGNGKHQVSTVLSGPLGVKRQRSEGYSNSNAVEIISTVDSYYEFGGLDPGGVRFNAKVTREFDTNSSIGGGTFTNVNFFDDFGNVYQEYGSQLGRRYYNIGDFGVTHRYVLSQNATSIDQRIKYDGYGRVDESIDYHADSAGADEVTTYTYDSCRSGSVCSMTESRNGISTYRQDYTYQDNGFMRTLDMALRMSSGSERRDYQFSFDYDNVNRRLQDLTYPDGFKVRYSYGATGQLNRVRNRTGNTNGVIYWESRSRDIYGQTQQSNLNNGGLTHVRSYDIQGRSTAIEMKRGSTQLRRQAYVYDGLGNVQRRDDSAFPNETFGYDGRNRLTHINGTQATTYGQGDNILTAQVDGKGGLDSYTYGNIHNINGTSPTTALTRLTQAGTRNLSYDEDGYVSSIVDSSDPKVGIADIEYNGRQKPYSITPYRSLVETMLDYGGNRLVYLQEAGETPDDVIQSYFAGKLHEENVIKNTADDSTESRSWNYIFADGPAPVAGVRTTESDSCKEDIERAITGRINGAPAVVKNARQTSTYNSQGAARAIDKSVSTFSETNSVGSSWNTDIDLDNDEWLHGFIVNCGSDCSKLRNVHVLFSMLNMSGMGLDAAKSVSLQQTYYKPAVTNKLCVLFDSPIKASSLSIRFDSSYEEPRLKLAEVIPYKFVDPDEQEQEPPSSHREKVAATIGVLFGGAAAVGTAGWAVATNFGAISSTAGSLRFWEAQIRKGLRRLRGQDAAEFSGIELQPIFGNSGLMRVSGARLAPQWTAQAVNGAVALQGTFTVGQTFVSALGAGAATSALICAVDCSIAVYGDEVDTSKPGTYYQVYVATSDDGTQVESIPSVIVVEEEDFSSAIRFEAETASTNQRVYSDPNASNQAGVDWDKAGSIDWVVTVPAEGDYKLRVGYALEGDPRTLNLHINDPQYENAQSTLSFPETTDWATYKGYSVTVSLNAGANTISLYKDNASGPNIDYLDVVGASVATIGDGGLGERYASFYRQSDTLLIGNSNQVEIGAAWTLSATFTDLEPNGAWRTLFRGAGGDHQIILRNSDGQLGSYMNGQGGFKGTGYNAMVLDDGQPHTITAVGSGSTTTFYVDGVRVGNPINAKSTTDIYAIGNYQGGTQLFSKQLDSVHIHARALNVAEIAKVASGERVNAGLAAYYDFEGANVAAQLSDKSGNDRDLSNNGVGIGLYPDSRVDFGVYLPSAYDPTQGGRGTATVSGGGARLSLNGNEWQKIAFPYTVTPNTVVEFDISSTAGSEVQGFGFSNDDAISTSANTSFQLAGTENWAIQEYAGLLAAPFSVKVVIPVGRDVAAGDYQYLTFINDDDEAPYGNTSFANLLVYEAGGGTVPIYGKTSNSIEYRAADPSKQWYTINYSGYSDGGAPAMLAQMQTTNDGDTAWVRMRNLDGDSVQIMLEEEKSFDAEIDHDSEVVGYLGFSEGDIENTQGLAIGEAGKVSASTANVNDWKTLTFDRTYSDPVIVMQMNTYNGPDPTHVRLRNVTGNSVQYKLEEWDYRDGGHTTETLSYIVAEKGSHDIGDGKELDVRSWERLGKSFTRVLTGDIDDIHVVIAQTQTASSARANVVRTILTPTNLSFQLEEEQGASVTLSSRVETVGYIMLKDSYVLPD